MHKVTFAREFPHPIDALRTANYPPDIELEVSNAVYEAAQKAGALKEKKADGQRPAKGD